MLLCASDSSKGFRSWHLTWCCIRREVMGSSKRQNIFWRLKIDEKLVRSTGKSWPSQSERYVRNHKKKPLSHFHHQNLIQMEIINWNNLSVYRILFANDFFTYFSSFLTSPKGKWMEGWIESNNQLQLITAHCNLETLLNPLAPIFLPNQLA